VAGSSSLLNRHYCSRPIRLSPLKKAHRGGRLSTSCGGHLLTPTTADLGCLWFTHDLSTAAQKPSAWAWQKRKGDHVWEKRCSGLDLLGCDPGSGYAARGFNTRETELASRSLLLRDDVRAASPSSPVVCRIVGAPPLCAPARVLPGLPSTSKYAPFQLAVARWSACFRIYGNPRQHNAL